MTAAGGDPASSSESSSSSLDTSDSSSSRSLSSERSQHEERSDGEGTSQGRQSSERSSSGTPSVSTPTVSGGTSLTPGPGLRARPGVPDFHAAVLNVVDMLHTTLACQVETEAQSAKSTEDSATQELQRIPSLQSLLKLKDGDVDELMGRPRRPSQGEGSPAEAKRPSHFRDRHGRMRHNWNSVNFETLALGMRNDKKAETELEKHWGDIAGKLAFVLTRLEQVVPMSKSRLLNEALGTGTRRMSEATMQVMEGVLQSRVDLGGLLQALSRSDPMRLLKDSANVSIFARLEEFAAYEKDISVREHQIDSPEMVHLVLQRWSVQQGFCLSNIVERRELARALCTARRSTTRRRNRRFNMTGTTARKKLAVEELVTPAVTQTPSMVSTSQSMAQEEETGVRNKEALRDLTTERGVLLEIKREMTKLKRKCRVLEGQWVEQPRVLLTRLENQCRSLRLSVEVKMSEIEVARRRLADANRRWRANRTQKEPTLVDLEIQAYDIRRELAMSVLRYVRKDRQEALGEWRAQMAKYHKDKVRMRGNFALAVKRWRDDANFAAPGPSGVNPWKASLAFTPEAVREGDPNEDDKLANRCVQVDQGLTLAGITRNQLINQERLLDNTKRPLGNSWELLRRQYMTYASILQGQLQHWLRGDFLGPLMRKIRDLTGQVHSSLVEVVGELEAVRAGAKEDLKVPELEARRREGDRRQRTGKDRSELKMEESIQAILLHLEKEMMLLANISAPRGELSLLLRAQQDLSALAAARPFSFDDLCGKTVPQPAPGGRKNSKSSAAGEPEPVSYFRIQEGLEAPVRAARSLVRLVTIQWNTYIAKWESLIRRYQEARNGYLEFQQKCAETARQKLLKDLRERPYLFQDLLEKSQAKWRQVEKEFHGAHVQPICDRYRDLANGVADLSTELLQQKKTTHAMKQDQALNFVQSLAEGSNEELLDKYRQELQAETQRSEELDRQIAAEKERNRIIWEQQMRPMLSNVAQASRLVQDLDGEEAVVARTSLSVEQVVRSEQLVEVMSFADRALRSRGYQAALAPRKLLQLIEALLWPDGAWKDPEEEARKAAEKTARKASVASVPVTSSPSLKRGQQPKPEAPSARPTSGQRAEQPKAPSARPTSGQRAEQPKAQAPSARSTSGQQAEQPKAQAPSPRPTSGQSAEQPKVKASTSPASNAVVSSGTAGAADISQVPSTPPTSGEQPEVPSTPPTSGVEPQGVITSPPIPSPEPDEDGILHLELDGTWDIRHLRRASTPDLDVGSTGSAAASDYLQPDTTLTSQNLVISVSVAPPAPSPGEPRPPTVAVVGPVEESPSRSALPSPCAASPPSPPPAPSNQEVESEQPPLPEPPPAPAPVVPLPSADEGAVERVMPVETPPLELRHDPIPESGLGIPPAEVGTPEVEGLQEGGDAAVSEVSEVNEMPPLHEEANIPGSETEVLDEGLLDKWQSPVPEEAHDRAEVLGEGSELVEGNVEKDSFMEEAPLSGEELTSERSGGPTPRKVRIFEQSSEGRDSQLEELPSELDLDTDLPPPPMLFQVFSHPERAQPAADAPQGRWKDWIKGAEAASSHSNPVLKRMQEVRNALHGASEPAFRPVRATASLRSWVKQRSRLAGAAAPKLPSGGLSLGDVQQPNTFKVPDRRPTRRSPPWMAFDRSRQSSPILQQPARGVGVSSSPPRLLITPDSAGRPGRLGTPTQITLDFDNEFTRPPSAPPGPCRTLGGGFKAPWHGHTNSRREGAQTPSDVRAEPPPVSAEGGLAVRARDWRAEQRPQSGPGCIEAQLWGHARPKGGQWRVLLGTGNEAHKIRTGDLDNLMSARGLQVKTPDVAESSPARSGLPTPAPSPNRPVALATQDLAELLHFVKQDQGLQKEKHKQPRRRSITRRPAIGAKYARAQQSPVLPAVLLESAVVAKPARQLK